MSCGVVCRHGLDPALLWLWLWHKPAAVAPIQPQAQELPYAASAILKKKKKKSGFPDFVPRHFLSSWSLWLFPFIVIIRAEAALAHLS